MWPNPQVSADLIRFTEEILNGKLQFCAVRRNFFSKKLYYIWLTGSKLRLCYESLNPLMYNVPKWSDTLQKCCSDDAKCLKCVRPFWDITVQKMKFAIKDFFSKCDQIQWFLRIWSHLLKENFFYALMG